MNRKLYTQSSHNFRRFKKIKKAICRVEKCKTIDGHSSRQTLYKRRFNNARHSSGLLATRSSAPSTCQCGTPAARAPSVCHPGHCVGRFNYFGIWAKSCASLGRFGWMVDEFGLLVLGFLECCFGLGSRFGSICVCSACLLQ